MALVTIGLVTWNSASDVARCLDGIRAQQHQPIELLVGDNASADGTRPILEARTTAAERRYFPSNLGFSAAHNALIRESRGAYYLTLNPDVVLDAGFVGALVGALDAAPRAGSATGKLRRAEPVGVIDSTGIVMHRSQRHVDRGADEIDRGQYERGRRRLRRLGRRRLLPSGDARRRRHRRRGVRRGLLRLS